MTAGAIAPDQLDRIAHAIAPQARVVRSWDLPGGVSAQVVGFEIARANGRRTKLVLRRHGPVDLAQNPRIAADEYRLLALLSARGLPVPAPYHLDTSGTVLPTPFLVVGYIEGETVFAPPVPIDAARQLAEYLAMIHRVDGTSADLSFLPDKAEAWTHGLAQPRAELDASIGEGQIRDALWTAWPPPQTNRSTLLHGDYWPGNVLWRDGHLVGIVDWEDVSRGDPLVDLGNTRLEILWAFGDDAMRAFTEAYASVTDVDLANLPYWDLCAALRPAGRIDDWAPDAAAAEAMRAAHRSFVQRALDALSRLDRRSAR